MVYSFDTLKQYVEETISTDVLEPHPEPDALYAPFRYSMNTGGKRLRPVLMLMAYNLFKDDVQSVLRPAVALEIFHNFTLLHDDIMDNSPIRRNQPTVHEKWNASTAILSGDAMLIKAYQMLSKYASEKALSDVLQVFNQVALNVCEGQQYDMDYEQEPHVDEAHYLHMISLKTSVLIAGAMKIGALLADADIKPADALYQYGLNLGLAFQLQDDFLDAFGDPEKFGKRIGGDIAANKKTYLLIKAFELANETQREMLNRWVFHETADREQKIREVIRIYREIGIDEIIKQKIDTFYSKAHDRLEGVDLTDERKMAIKETADRLMMRAY